MVEFKLKSTCKRIKDIPWNETLMVSKIFLDESLLNHHKERVNRVFQNASEEVKEQQLQNILVRDTLFNLAMDKIVTCYEFNIDNDDLKVFTEMLKNSGFQFPSNETSLDERLKIIATKLIQKELIFIDIASLYNIEVTAEETLAVLNQFQQETGQSIDDIKQDKNKLNGAVSSLLEEKITAFIINKFEKDFSELQRNIQLDQEARAKAEAEEAAKNKATTDDTKN